MATPHASSTTGINLAAKLATFSEPWQPRVVGQFNGHELMNGGGEAGDLTIRRKGRGIRATTSRH
jgi:hypothetical protein